MARPSRARAVRCDHAASVRVSTPKKGAARKRKLRPQEIAQARIAEMHREDVPAILAKAQDLSTADVAAFSKEVEERMASLDD